jgi:hypothetical protein
MAYPFDRFEIGDAQSGSWMANRPLWIGIAVIATAFTVPFYENSAYFWATIIVAVCAWVVGLGGHAKVIVDTAKREIRFSEKTLWSEKPRRVIRFEDVASSEIAYCPAGEGDTYLPRLILRSGEKVALTTTGCEDRDAADNMVRRVLEAVGIKPRY